MRTTHISAFIPMSLGIALFVAACGTATPYQAAIDRYGYAEQSLEEDRYRVTFAGNTLTARETVENYLLYRAAEVTLARGYDHFIVVDTETERSTTYRSTATGFHGHRSFYYGYPHGFGGFTSATSRPRNRYTAFANIVMREGEKPAGDTDAYDARDVLERLSPAVSGQPSS